MINDGEGCDDEWTEATDELAAAVTLLQGESNAPSVSVENGQQSTSDNNHNPVQNYDEPMSVRPRLSPRFKPVEYLIFIIIRFSN